MRQVRVRRCQMSRTSKCAYEYHQATGYFEHLEGLVLKTVYEHPGATPLEVVWWADMPEKKDSISPRFVALERQGLISRGKTRLSDLTPWDRGVQDTPAETWFPTFKVLLDDVEHDWVEIEHWALFDEHTLLRCFRDELSALTAKAKEESSNPSTLYTVAGFKTRIDLIQTEFDDIVFNADLEKVLYEKEQRYAALLAKREENRKKKKKKK